jgi:hypothetical protein
MPVVGMDKVGIVKDVDVLPGSAALDHHLLVAAAQAVFLRGFRDIFRDVLDEFLVQNRPMSSFA